MMELQFRLAKKEDLDSVMDMFTAAIAEMSREGIEQWDSLYPDKSTLENDIEDNQLFIGMLQDSIVSAYVLNQEYDEQYANGAWKYPNSSFYVIHRLCVNPLFQNQRIGTLTLTHIENELRAKGIDAIRLDAYTLNPYAIKMYERLEYGKVGFAKWRKGEFYLMEKKL
jgi:ribosomal protein S18 acetylase RimI-like enzyme